MRIAFGTRTFKHLHVKEIEIYLYNRTRQTVVPVMGSRIGIRQALRRAMIIIAGVKKSIMNIRKESIGMNQHCPRIAHLPDRPLPGANKHTLHSHSILGNTPTTCLPSKTTNRSPETVGPKLEPLNAFVQHPTTVQWYHR